MKSFINLSLGWCKAKCIRHSMRIKLTCSGGGSGGGGGGYCDGDDSDWIKIECFVINKS